MFKKAFLPMLLCLSACLYGKTRDDAIIPFSNVFHHIGKNTLNTLTYNYGLNFVGAGLGTYALIASGADWQYNRMAYNNPPLAYAGLPSLYIGYVIPVALPLTLYLAGRGKLDGRAQVAGLAAAQSAMISLAYMLVFKGVTGRISPGIIDVLDHERSRNTADYSADFAWGFGRRGFIAGWPSAHTAIAFASTAALSQIYADKTWVKIASYSYAAFIGLGISLCVHWSSEVFAGALIGIAVGSSVGKDFAKMLTAKKTDESEVSVVFSFNSIGVKISRR